MIVGWPWNDFFAFVVSWGGVEVSGCTSLIFLGNGKRQVDLAIKDRLVTIA